MKLKEENKADEAGKAGESNEALAAAGTATEAPLIVYSNEDTETPFLVDHLDFKGLSAIMMSDMTKSAERQKTRRVLLFYIMEIFKRPENQCFRKDNSRSSTTRIHIGSNCWRTTEDKDLYPSLLCHFANTFQEYLYKNDARFSYSYKSYIKKTLISFLDYMAEEGYCNEKEKEKAVLKDYHILVKQIKNIVYDYSILISARGAT
jgi:hypothetical protein